MVVASTGFRRDRGTKRASQWGLKMREQRVGMRDLKSKLSEYIRDVQAGATVVVTDHGRQVARIVPETDSNEQRLAALRATGAFLWSGRRLRVTKPDVRIRGTSSVSEIAIENRG